MLFEFPILSQNAESATKIDPVLVPRFSVLMNNLVSSLCDSGNVPPPIRSNLTIDKACYFSQSGPKSVILYLEQYQKFLYG